MQQISAFSFYLRTGRRRREDQIERKYNHWHDPDDGRFTLAGQGRYFAGGPSAQAQASTRWPVGRDVSNGQIGRRQQANKLSGLDQPNDSAPIKLAQNSRNPRIRMRGNGGPPLHDPRTLEHAFPGLSNAPGGAIIALADNFFDLTGPAQAATTGLSEAYRKSLIRDIEALDPTFSSAALERDFPSTSEGQANLINRLRLERARSYYQRGDYRPLQVEVLRFLKRRVDAAYFDGLILLRNGKLNVLLSPREALGNYVDRRVRDELRDFVHGVGISTEFGQPVRINNRAYHTSETTFSVPDSRVGNIAFDVSLTEKQPTTRQVRGFFKSDFQPSAVVIIRPSQLGPQSIYIIVKPRSR